MKITFGELKFVGILVEDDVDEGSWDGHVVADGYTLQVIDSKTRYTHDVTVIQRVFDEPEQRDNLFCMNGEGTTVYTAPTNDLEVRIFKEIKAI